MSRHATRLFRGDRLREARKLRGLSAENFAREVDVTLRTVLRWENGESQPGGLDLTRIAAATDRHTSWFYEPTDLEPAA